MSLMPEIREELYAAAASRAAGNGSSRPRNARSVPGGGVLLIVLSAAVAVAVAAVLLSVHTSAGGSPAVGHRHARFSSAPSGAFRLLRDSRTNLVSRDPSCRPRRSHKFLLSGRPARSITRVLGVFRTPASSGHRVSPHLIRVLSGQGNGIYAPYARTGVINRVRYYLLPQRNLIGFQAQPARCGHEWLIEFRKLAQRLPAGKRVRMIKWGTRVVGFDASQAESPVGVQLITSYGGGGGHNWEFISDIRAYREGGSGGGDADGGFTITAIIVPNAVAAVTADYPAENQVGHVRHQVITQRARDNIVLFRITGGWDPPSLTYRSATGAILSSSPKR